SPAGHQRRPRRPAGRDRGHPARGVLAALPNPLHDEPDGRHAQDVVAGGRTLLHSVFDQPDADSVAAQYDRIIDALGDKLPKVAEHLEDARADLLAFTAFPKQIWRQIWYCGEIPPVDLEAGYYAQHRRPAAG